MFTLRHNWLSGAYRPDASSSSLAALINWPAAQVTAAPRVYTVPGGVATLDPSASHITLYLRGSPPRRLDAGARITCVSVSSSSSDSWHTSASGDSLVLGLADGRFTVFSVSLAAERARSPPRPAGDTAPLAAVALLGGFVASVSKDNLLEVWGVPASAATCRRLHQLRGTHCESPVAVALERRSRDEFAVAVCYVSTTWYNSRAQLICCERVRFTSGALLLGGTASAVHLQEEQEERGKKRAKWERPPPLSVAGPRGTVICLRMRCDAYVLQFLCCFSNEFPIELVELWS